MLDDINLQILNILQQDARVSNAEIARQVGLTPSATLERIRKLETNGFINAYQAWLNPKAFGLDLTAFIFVKVDEPIGSWEAGEFLARIPGVQEVHHVTGEDCYLLKVRTMDTEDLGNLIKTKIGALPNITSTRTTVVLKTVKESCSLPLVEEE
jgi:Lrp/AsnC family leucine-responsive transcriptional regulator